MKYNNDNDSDSDIDEDMKLTRKDYITILHHYQPTSRRRGHSRGHSRGRSLHNKLSTKTLKMRAHKILGVNCCECIVKNTLQQRKQINVHSSSTYSTARNINNSSLLNR
jgi:hypothetical protein